MIFVRLQRVGDLHGHRVGIDAIGFAIAIETERRHDRNDSLVEEKLQAGGIDALDLAGVELVHAVEDARGKRDDGVRVDGAQVHGGEALHDLVRDARGRVQADGERVSVGDARAVGVGNHHAEFGGAAFDLVARAVDDDDLDVERTQDGDVEQDVAEILRLDDLAVDGDHESALAETGNILEDAAEVGDLHEWQKREANLRGLTV